LLQKELASMKPNEGKDLKLPVFPEATLQVTKMSNDVYTGNIYQNGKIIAKFANRSLPGVGLVIMSTFELYDMESLASMPIPQLTPDISKIQAIIDERIGLHHLVRQVVDQRISEREALDQIIRSKLTQAITEASLPIKQEENNKDQKPITIKKEPKLKNFLDKKENKRKRPEFHVVLNKNEKITCPDCKKNIFMKGVYSGCVCLETIETIKYILKKLKMGFL